MKPKGWRMIGHNASEGIEPRNFHRCTGPKVTCPGSQQRGMRYGEYAATCRGRSPWQVIQRFASELGRHRDGIWYVAKTSPHSGTGTSGAAMPVYELGSFAGRAIPGMVLLPARQGPSQWHRWSDVERVWRASGRESAGLGGSNEGQAVSTAARQTSLHSQRRAFTETARTARS